MIYEHISYRDILIDSVFLVCARNLPLLEVRAMSKKAVVVYSLFSHPFTIISDII
jgi:hypothetical protein